MGNPDLHLTRRAAARCGVRTDGLERGAQLAAAFEGYAPAVRYSRHGDDPYVERSIDHEAVSRYSML